MYSKARREATASQVDPANRTFQYPKMKFTLAKERPTQSSKLAQPAGGRQDPVTASWGSSWQNATARLAESVNS
jgi:hypothetical protein